MRTASAIKEGRARAPHARRRFYPMGYPLDIVSGSAAVFRAAREIWGRFTALCDAPPVVLRIEVASAEALLAPIPAMPCHFEHLMAIVQGPENFGIADMTAGCGVINVTRDVVRNAPWFVYHFLEPIAYVLLGARHFTILHAACAALEGKAAVLCGPSGAGKTCLSFACATRGWRFVSGDATHLVRDAADATVIGRPFSIRFRSSAKAVFPELKACRAALRPNGKCDIEVETDALCLATAVKARAALVVFLNRAPGADISAEMAPVPAEEARALLGESICFGDAASRVEQREALERLLCLPLVRLTYSDPFSAEPVLRSALRGAS
jgi:hypothetical protein